MPAVGLLVVVVLLAILTMVIWLVTHRHRRLATANDPEIAALLRSAERRVVAAIIVGLALFLGCAALGALVPQLLGLPLTLGAGLAGTTGLLVYAIVPPRSMTVAPGARREVSLQRRTPLSAAPRAVIALLIVAIVNIGYLLFTGISASTDESGHSRQISFSSAAASSAAGPYPGWFYAVPLMTMTVVSVAAALLALGRVSAVPALPRADLHTVDTRWRRATGSVIILVSAAALLFQTGGAATFGGNATRSAILENVGAGWHVIAWTSLIGGVLLLLGSIVAITSAALTALHLQQFALDQSGEHDPRPAENAAWS